MDNTSEGTPGYVKMEYFMEGSRKDLAAVADALGDLRLDIKGNDLNFSGDKLIWEFGIQKDDMPELKRALENLEREYITLIIHPMGLDDQHMNFGRILYGSND